LTSFYVDAERFQVTLFLQQGDRVVDKRLDLRPLFESYHRQAGRDE
jgi:hypothetical protein